MEVPCDALALGNGGEGEVLIQGGAQLALGAALLREENIAATDDGHKKDGDEPFASN